MGKVNPTNKESKAVGVILLNPQLPLPPPLLPLSPRSGLHRIAQDFSSWFFRVKKSKAIWQTLNLFVADDRNGEWIVGECWVPKSQLDHLDMELRFLEVVLVMSHLLG